MKLSRVPTALLLGVVLPLTGCQTYEEYGLTHKLWTDVGLTEHNEPAGTPTVRTFRHPTRARMLVTYDEHRERDNSVRRRAFFLPESAKALAQHGKPSFTSPAPAAGWVEIPVLTAGQPAPATSLYLKLAVDNKSFTIVRDGVADGPHQLPTYADQGSTAFRVALTPVAVVADATVVAVWCGVVGLYVYAGGPLNFR